MSNSTINTWTAPRLVRLGQIADVAANTNAGTAQTAGGSACGGGMNCKS
ncbi:MAG: hypothetical protein WA842_14830 [Croceibacterium sp.]